MPKKKRNPKKNPGADPSENAHVPATIEVLPPDNKPRKPWQWQPGNGGGHNKKNLVDFNELRMLALEGSREAMLGIIALATDPEPDDERIKFTAAAFVIERAVGKAPDHDKMPPLGKVTGKPDLKKLSAKELDQLHKLIDKVAPREAA